MAPRSPNQIDIHIGNRLHKRRVFLEQSRQDIGEAIGVSHQQIQKYEKGINRISASRLYACAEYMDTSLDYFFKGM